MKRRGFFNLLLICLFGRKMAAHPRKLADLPGAPSNADKVIIGPDGVHYHVVNFSRERFAHLEKMELFLR